MQFVITYFSLLALSSCSTLTNVLFPEDTMNTIEQTGMGRSEKIVLSNTHLDTAADSLDEPFLERDEVAAVSNANRALASTPTYRRNSPEEDLHRNMDGSLFDSNSSLGFYFSRNQLKKVSDILIVKVGSEINEFLRAKIKGALTKKYGEAALEEASITVEQNQTGASATTADKNLTVKDEAAPKPAAKSPASVANNGKATDRKSLSMDANNVDIGDITVRISKDLGRGIYEVGGEKNIFIYNKKYTMSLLGTVRAEDIAVDGTVSSEKIADSRIEFKK